MFGSVAIKPHKYSVFAIPLIEKIVGLASIGGAISNVALLRRFLTDIASVVVLSVLSSMAGGMLILCAFYWMYVGLIYYGVGREDALLALTSLAILLTILLVSWTTVRIRLRLRSVSAQAMTSEKSPAPLVLPNVVNAFIDGLKEGRIKN